MKKKFPFIINKDRSDNVPIHIYSDTDKKYIEDNCSHLLQLPHIKDPLVFLTDLNYKPQLETPSSSVILSHNYFSLALTSPSQNCGMNLATTPFFKEDFSPILIGKFMTLIKSAIPLTNPDPLLTKEDVFQALRGGAHWAVKHYDLPSNTIDNIECTGNLLNEENIEISEIRNAIPDEVVEFSRKRFRIIGGGNHFFELQYVDEIINNDIAEKWGLQKNQIVIMYHTGSDAIGAYLGRLFASRKKTNLKYKIAFFTKKIKYHLMQGPWKSIPERLKYYFSPGIFRFINPDTQEGKRALLAVNCSANFGFACRIAIFHEICKVLRQISGDLSTEVKLLYDCSHNSIYKEMIKGNEVWAHRHNSCRVYPPSLLQDHPIYKNTGQPVILPGTNQTSSFICAGCEGATATHFTVDHGLGAVQKSFEKKSSPEHLKEFALKFQYDSVTPEKVPMLPDTAVNKAVEVLNKADIVQTIARLKPIATLKGSKSKVV